MYIVPGGKSTGFDGWSTDWDFLSDFAHFIVRDVMDSWHLLLIFPSLQTCDLIRTLFRQQACW